MRERRLETRATEAARAHNLMDHGPNCVPQVVALNEAYTRVEFRLDREGFDHVPALIRYYVGNRKPVSPVSWSRARLVSILAGAS